MSHPHPELSGPPPLPEGALRVTPLGGLGEIGRNMTVFEYGGKLLIVDCGVLFPEEAQPGVDLILPDFTSIRDRLDDVVGVVLTHGHEDHIGGVPYLLKERGDIPLVGSQADPGAGRGQAGRAPDPRPTRCRSPRATRSGSARSTASSSRSTTRSRTPWPWPISTPAGTGAAHRRLQDGPAAAGRPAHRPGRLRPARRARASTCCCPTPPTPRCPASSPPSGTSPRCWTGSSARPSRRIIVACFACHVHRVQQVFDAAAAHGRKVALRRPLDGPQHGRRPRPGLPEGAGGPDRRPEGRSTTCRTTRSC